MTRRLPLFPALALLLLLAAAGPAWAHKLKVFATVEGAEIVGTAYFAGGGTAADADTRVLAPDGNVAAMLRTDAQGRFRFTPALRQDHTIAVDAGDGHAARFTVPASDLPESLPAGQGAPSPSFAPAAESTGPAAPPPEDLAALVERAVARQIRPLREQLDAAENRARLSDIIGGVGAIFGLFGIGAWAAARRHK